MAFAASTRLAKIIVEANLVRMVRAAATAFAWAVTLQGLVGISNWAERWSGNKLDAGTKMPTEKTKCFQMCFTYTGFTTLVENPLARGLSSKVGGRVLINLRP